MSKILKKGNKLVETIQKTVPMDKLIGLQDFYLMKQRTQFAIRDVQAYHIKNTDMVLVLGSLDLAEKTAKQAAEKRKARLQAMAQEQQHQCTEQCGHAEAAPQEEDVVEDAPVEESKESAASDINITEEDIKVVMEQGGVSREESIKLLKENGGDPLSILMSLGK
ncbi:nascent polypeptide-associated complex subunit alpha [Nematocida parisii]|uniref:Nascent polypeptide-associated complex subunit alpha-like UBA domain-containing protein n=1 Tax=Nematocida parisii (strain ERTm3) TaxID=935791 RepID=I3EJN6_NEMP3|nr:uncharacterized protein NEPG_01040 [Nematocida parisii ERTm1]EIJ89433.1 hypothetical protein NEQG_00203 [Nematocida parisii ERTm3]KAI5129839.1 nascent polypeptide-associated complex subunit alpha [Nematocida parisii]EIJ94373.1 hypothetical protein NEPG_01040 [Nematocida parisii ERTm1]KAI5130731.1 nascent polypeptide-associated complex subunit alpha [Nematocida parisii]KAI5145211.1 nascent polypeptide-associated complex subunit alpha [Nematocida parisii]|eukprot:XP_013058868.1 hypothetical protein NEPG_01040 [Nematocida parisii ERTm1]